MEQIKHNYCVPAFKCHEPISEYCVYFMKEQGVDGCKYEKCGYCDSAVAQVNYMTVELKRMTS